MNSEIFLTRRTFKIQVLAIIAACIFIFASCKKEVITAAGTASITGFSPSSGPSGTTVIISGTNFSTVLASNTVTFNGVHATVSGATIGQITATVPVGAITGRISITVNGTGGTATSSSDFTVTQ